MIGELHLTEPGDACVLRRDLHVSLFGTGIGPRTMMFVPAGETVYLLCVLVYPDGFREAVVEYEGGILHVPEADLGPQPKEGG